MQQPTRRPPLRLHPEDISWPTKAWPVGAPPAAANSAGLQELIDQGFGPQSAAELSLNFGLAISYQGKLVAEHYGETADDQESLISWSMGKSFVHAIVGFLVADGALQLDSPTGLPDWAEDARSQITLQHLLEMCSGLEFVEDYLNDQVSDVIEMLFGQGKDDVAAFARAKPLVHKPGTVHNYSSGTTNIVSAICGQAINGGEAGMRRFLDQRLFGPLGMTSADPRFDQSGTFIGSSFLYATAQDFLRFGYLYLRDGIWEGKQLLPHGWTDHARTPVDPAVEEAYWYGAHWWIHDDDLGAFSANGYEGQYIVVVPDRDLVLVRLGKTPAERADPVRSWLREIIECFPLV